MEVFQISVGKRWYYGGLIEWYYRRRILNTLLDFKLHSTFTILWFCEFWAFMSSMCYCFHQMILKFCWVETILSSTILQSLGNLQLCCFKFSIVRMARISSSVRVQVFYWASRYTISSHSLWFQVFIDGSNFEFECSLNLFLIVDFFRAKFCDFVSFGLSWVQCAILFTKCFGNFVWLKQFWVLQHFKVDLILNSFA